MNRLTGQLWQMESALTFPLRLKAFNKLFSTIFSFFKDFLWPPYEPKVIKGHKKAVYILSLFHTRWKVSIQSIHFIIKTFNAIKFEIYRFPYLFYTRQSISLGHLHCEMVVEICDNFKTVRSWYQQRKKRETLNLKQL